MADGQSKHAKKSERVERNRIYGNPLPIILPTSTSKHVLGMQLFRTADALQHPRVSGVFDSTTRSVWILRAEHSRLLWERGFFGKGSLSRSEPTWLARLNNSISGSGSRTAEEVTAQRREQRRQFKEDRTRLMLEAVHEAEAAFSVGNEGHLPDAHEVSRAARSNRAAPNVAESDEPLPTTETVPQLDPEEDLEFLQVTLEEAFYLAWSLDVLRVLNTVNQTVLSLPDLWQAFQGVHIPGSVRTPARSDNPFIVNYAMYHHFRSLGWVVRSGIKFCTDLLLYKRGPVFTHAEFAVVVCPVYEDDADRATSPFHLDNSGDIQWASLSTIGRVNSQVHKTVILAYVTIPSMRAAEPGAFDSPRCLNLYSVREVVLRRWVPARLRD